MKHSQQGFTLIELVMVIVILGILAATAIPRFVDLSTDAANAALQSVSGSLNSASAVNYATRAARGSVASGGTGFQVTTGGCTAAVAGSLLNDGLPTGYTIAYDAGAAIGDATAFGQTWSCTVDNADANNGPIKWTLHYVD